jgi:lysozyme family protein
MTTNVDAARGRTTPGQTPDAGRAARDAARDTARRDTTARDLASRFQRAEWGRRAGMETRTPGNQGQWNDALGRMRDAVRAERTPDGRSALVRGVLDRLPEQLRDSVSTAFRTADARADDPRRGPLERAPGGMRSRTANSPDAAGIVPAETRTAQLLDHHRTETARMQSRLDPAQTRDMAAFRQNYEANRARYEDVGRRTNTPPELVAALHWRESTGDFGTYLHQGDPLGRPPRNVPRDIPTFHDWESAAVHAMQRFDGTRQTLGVDGTTTDLARLSAFAEMYNGLGYRARGAPSPYVYAGTDRYDRGKFVADHRYDPQHVDRQLGVAAMIDALRGQ